MAGRSGVGLSACKMLQVCESNFFYISYTIEMTLGMCHLHAVDMQFTRLSCPAIHTLQSFASLSIYIQVFVNIKGHRVSPP